MLYSERKRLKEIENREANGESLWTYDAPVQFRNKLKRSIRAFGWVANEYDQSFGLNQIVEFAAAILAASRGEQEQDIVNYIDYCESSVIPDVIESFALSIRHFANKGIKEPLALESFQSEINGLLESYRLSYSLEGVEIIEFESREAHVSIIAPTLRLTSQPGWESVEKSYQDALKELAAGNPSDAITDATTALQEALRKLGCKGEDLAALLKSAKTTILVGFDNKYIEAIDNLVSWSSANRSKRGDSHKVIKISKDDAWFVVHVIGVLILRLSKTKQ